MRLASKPFSQNRAFSSKVRDFVKKGEVEEAQKLCKEQVNQLNLPPFYKDLSMNLLFVRHQQILDESEIKYS